MPAALLALAATLLGHALQINNGFFDERALLWLFIAILCGAVATLRLLPAALVEPLNHESVVTTVLIAGIASNLLTLPFALPGLYLDEPLPSQHPAFLAGVAIAALLFIAGATRMRAMRRLWFPLLLVTFAGLGVWMIAASPHPLVDVMTVYESAAKALAAGKNPYTMTIPNIYGSPDFYPEGLVIKDRVLLGFPYPPLSLMLGLPGQWLGDVRYANLAALIGAAALIGYARDSIIAPLAATLMLTTPRMLFVLEQAWTEPITLLMFGATIYAASNARRLLPVMLGLLIASKQYMIVALPLAWLLTTPSAPLRARVREWLWLGGIAIAVAAIVTVPFMLWSIRGFTHSVILLQFIERIRLDSLSVLTWLAYHHVALTPKRVIAASAVGLLSGLLLTMWRASRTTAGFAAAIALSLLCVFVSSKKAFCNYYFFALGVMCCSVAAVRAADEAGGIISKE
jgi:hypothetical protein